VASTAQLIEQAVTHFQSEVPGLAKLKLVFGLELRGRGDIQLYRVELPGPKVTKGYAEDEKLHVSIPRADFNELADAGIERWHEAYDQGHVKVEVNREMQKLLGTVIGRKEARGHLRRAR
jgi:hypothetical protein